MSESIITTQGTKEEQYTTLLAQIKALIEGESDLIANMANICAALKEQFNWLWIGFYLVKEDQLVLGPFQGPIACTRINFNKGVCGAAWAMKKTILVPDVDQFPGHIACSSLSKSEIVIPLIHNNEVLAVLDIDSADLDSFDLIDKNNLEQMITDLLG
ncbi:MAG: GAF domain-containing protein [Saprospiraceae bacterium]